MRNKLEPIHPGEHLADILSEAGLSANTLSLQIRVPANRITSIIQGKRNITADTALRLARDAVGEQIERDVTPLRKAG